MFVRVRQFGIDNTTDFPPGSIGAAQFAAVGDEVDLIDNFGADQAAGFGEARQQFEIKDTARENLRDDMSDIARTARSMEYQFDGIGDKFRMPRNRNDQELLATARAFATEAVPYQADFVAYGLGAAFIAELQTLIDAFEATLPTTSSAIDEHVAATANIAESIRRGMRAVRILIGVVQNKYANNVGKLAAWLSASHIEKAKKKEVPIPPVP